MSSDKAEYMPLQPTDTSPDTSDTPDDTSPYTPPSSSQHALLLPPILMLAFLAALGTTMLNVSLLPFTLSALQSQKSAAPRWPEPTYEPNREIGLEHAPDLLGAPKDFSQQIPWKYQNGTRVEVNVVFPSLVAHINQSDPEVVYSQESEGEEKRVVLSHANSMILQFTNLQPDLQSCAIVGFRPSATDLTTPRPYNATGEINMIEVWNLTRTSSLPSSPLFLNPGEVSYDHRPPRKNYLGNVDFRVSPNSTTNIFPCPHAGEQLEGGVGDGSVNVELRCQRWECWVELGMREQEWREGTRLGFGLAQWNHEVRE